MVPDTAGPFSLVSLLSHNWKPESPGGETQSEELGWLRTGVWCTCNSSIFSWIPLKVFPEYPGSQILSLHPPSLTLSSYRPEDSRGPFPSWGLDLKHKLPCVLVNFHRVRTQCGLSICLKLGQNHGLRRAQCRQPWRLWSQPWTFQEWQAGTSFMGIFCYVWGLYVLQNCFCPFFNLFFKWLIKTN